MTIANKIKEAKLNHVIYTRKSVITQLSQSRPVTSERLLLWIVLHFAFYELCDVSRQALCSCLFCLLVPTVFRAEWQIKREFVPLFPFVLHNAFIVLRFISRVFRHFFQSFLFNHVRKPPRDDIAQIGGTRAATRNRRPTEITADGRSAAALGDRHGCSISLYHIYIPVHIVKLHKVYD